MDLINLNIQPKHKHQAAPGETNGKKEWKVNLTRLI